MKVKREEDNAVFTLIKVKPWPEIAFAADVHVMQEKRERDTGARINHVYVNYSGYSATIKTAREWASAILRACDIAEQLQRDGPIVLEGE